MIEVDNIEITGWEAAMRGMRNPLNSWDKNDSKYVIEQKPDETLYTRFRIGPNDLDLAKRLISAGPSDRKFLRMIHVSWDVNAPLYWWKDADQYKVATVTNSCSTMHKIHSRELTRSDFSCEHLYSDSISALDDTIKTINSYIRKFKTSKNKEDWWQIIQLLPSSYNQKRTWDLNYETLLGMYFSRRYHKQDEWRELCKVIETLPYMNIFIGVLDKKKEEKSNDI